MSLLKQFYIFMLLQYVTAISVLYFFAAVLHCSSISIFLFCSMSLLKQFYIFLLLQYVTDIAVLYIYLLLQYVTAIAVLYISVAAVCHCCSGSLFLFLQYFTAIEVLYYCCCIFSLL